MFFCVGVALEGNAVRDWLIDNGFGTVGFTGVSLGGHTAAVCISVCPDPAPCVPAFCWSNSAGVWTRGALSNRINWTSLYHDIQAHVGYRELLDELGTGLELWMSKNDKLDISTLPEVTQMPFTELTSENVAKNYMITLANYFSHLGNYHTPKDPSQTAFITGNFDYFYGHEFMTPIDQVWPGVKVRLLRFNHVGRLCHACIFKRDILKYYSLDISNILFCYSDSFIRLHSVTQHTVTYRNKTFLQVTNTLHIFLFYFLITRLTWKGVKY